MKNLLNKKIFTSILLLVFICGGLIAQRTVNLKEEIKNGQELSLELEFANKIDVKTWNGDEVKIKATVNINDNEYNDKFKFEIERSTDELTIKSEIEDLKEISKKERKEDNEFNMDFDFEIFIPEKIATDINTINGNIIMMGNYGSLCLNTISGNIELKAKFEELSMNSISGFVDLSVRKNIEANFTMSTITGEVYTDLDLEKKSDSKSKHWVVGHKINKEYNGGGKDISLVTISGDIYVRESK